MRTLKTATVKKRLAILLQKSREFVRNQYIQKSILQDRCPHEESTKFLAYDQHSTIYCSVCDKVLEEPYRMS